MYYVQDLPSDPEILPDVAGCSTTQSDPGNISQSDPEFLPDDSGWKGNMGRKSGKNGLVTKKERVKRIQCEYKSETTAVVAARIAAAARECTAVPYLTWPYRRILRQLIWRYPAMLC